MLTLHLTPDVQARPLLWIMEELSLDYEMVLYEAPSPERPRAFALQRLHPLGMAPIVLHDNASIACATAIIDYLLDTFDATHTLHPAHEDESRAAHQFWLRHAQEHAPPHTGDESARAVHWRPVVGFWAQALGEREWVVGDNLQAADIVLYEAIIRAKQMGLTAPHPVLNAFIERCQRRPAWQRAQARCATVASMVSHRAPQTNLSAKALIEVLRQHFIEFEQSLPGADRGDAHGVPLP